MAGLKRVRLSDSVVDALKTMLTEDGFEPGDKFYSEKELTEKLQVSRSSVREGVRIIEAKGLVSVKHGKGIYVAEPVESEFAALADWLRNNEQSIADLFDVRLILEPKVAAAAAAKAGAEDVARMEEASESFQECVAKNNMEEAMVHDRAFHKHMAQATKNKTLFLLMKAITTTQFEGWISSLNMPGRMQKTVGEHGAVLDAIKAGDAEGAMNAMTEHLENAVSDIRASTGNGK